LFPTICFPLSQGSACILDLMQWYLTRISRVTEFSHMTSSCYWRFLWKWQFFGIIFNVLIGEP
jgi:hypothetical protein